MANPPNIPARAASPITARTAPVIIPANPEPMGSNIHHPVRLVSCNRLAVTAKEGNKRANPMMIPRKGIQKVTIRTMKENRKNHQYSGREALPLKSMYFWKQVLMESVKLMVPVPF